MRRRIRDSVRVRTDEGKLLQAASWRRIRARMVCGRVPLNEERKQALTRVCEIQGPPIQDAAIGAGTRAGSRPVERDSRLAKNLGKPIEVVLTRRPADEPRHRHAGDAYELSHARRFWVRCHDLEVLALSEREEGVPRATAGMDAPNCGSDASVLLDTCDTAIEVVTAEDDVIQHGDAFVAARDRTGQKSRPDVLHRNQAAESHHCMESLEDWLGGRDSNPETLVQSFLIVLRRWWQTAILQAHSDHVTTESSAPSGIFRTSSHTISSSRALQRNRLFGGAMLPPGPTR
jgi:hypothetical protein